MLLVIETRIHMNPKVLITGGTGLIGNRLCEMLTQKGFHVSLLSQTANKKATYKTFVWNITMRHFDVAALENVSYIINLAGAGIADRAWTKKRKKEIIDSRVKSAELLYYTLKSTKNSVKAVISASAIGFYGDTGEDLVTEEHICGFDFLANTCQQWEHATGKINELGIRTLSMRIGTVLSNSGGALPLLAGAVKRRLGAALGTGQQYVSWVHIDDVCRAFIYALDCESLQGVSNLVAPYPVTNYKLNKSIAEVLQKPRWLPNIPAGLLRLILGEKANLVLASNRVCVDKLVDSGFTFKYPDLIPALQATLIDTKQFHSFSMAQA